MYVLWEPRPLVQLFIALEETIDVISNSREGNVR